MSETPVAEEHHDDGTEECGGEFKPLLEIQWNHAEANE